MKKEALASLVAEPKPSCASASLVGDAHALAAAAGRCLDHDGVADLLGDLHRLVGIGNRREIAGGRC